MVLKLYTNIACKLFNCLDLTQFNYLIIQNKISNKLG
jgi:hypothetical protein